MLINNVIQAFKEGVSRISTQFPNATITVGHLPGTENLADGMTKFGSLETFREDAAAATCANGEFKFIGLVERIFRVVEW